MYQSKTTLACGKPHLLGRWGCYISNIIVTDKKDIFNKNPFANLEGQKIYDWTVLCETEPLISSGTKRRRWLCRCSCGTEKTVLQQTLAAGGSRSCGCARGTHRLWKTPEYKSWSGMLYRCFDKKCKSYKNYGARGITVCERWKNSIEAFIADMGSRPSPKHSIDRINNDGNYEPGNCRWATMSDQCRNRRPNKPIEYNGKTQLESDWAKEFGISQTTLEQWMKKGISIENAAIRANELRSVRSQRMIEFNGKKQCLAHWARDLGMNFKTLQYRIRNWPVEQALSSINHNEQRRILFEYRGVAKTSHEWGKELNVSKNFVRQATDRGLSMEDVVKRARDIRRSQCVGK